MYKMKKVIKEITLKYEVYIRHELWATIQLAEMSKQIRAILSIWIEDLDSEHIEALKIEITRAAQEHSYAISIFHNNTIMLMDLEEI